MANKNKGSHKRPTPKNVLKEPAPKTPPLWKRPFAWFGALVLGSLGVALSGWIVPQMTDVINRFAETGDPVTVQVEELGPSGPIAFPSSDRLSNDVIRELGQLPVDDQYARLQSLGGVGQGQSDMTLTVTGNRANEVRITNIAPIVDCSVPDTGALVRLYSSFPAPAASTGMEVALDDDSAVLHFRDENGMETPYFPTNTIALKQDEQVVIVVRAWTAEATCSFELEMKVLEGSETRLQRVTNNGEPFVRGPSTEQEQFEKVYLGGEICSPYVEFQGDYDPENCQPPAE